MPSYSLAGPGSVTAGEGAAFTLTPIGSTSDTVTFSDGGHGGTFSPTSLSWSNNSQPRQVAYTNATAGTYSIGATSGNGYTIAGSPHVLLVLAASTLTAAQKRRKHWFPQMTLPRKR